MAPQRSTAAGGDGDGRDSVDGDREDEPAVVVGVFADQVHTARRLPDLVGVTAGPAPELLLHFPDCRDRAPRAPDPWQTARVQKGQQGEGTNAAKITTWRACRSDGSNESAGVGGTTRPRGDQ